MTPRDFRVLREAKIALRNEDRKFRDMLQARQIAEIKNVWCATEDNPIPYQPAQCMAFLWDAPAEEIHDMTEDEMERFDRRMDSWEIAMREKFKHG